LEEGAGAGVEGAGAVEEEEGEEDGGSAEEEAERVTEELDLEFLGWEEGPELLRDEKADGEGASKSELED
jgi:hypothetical protein